MTTEDAVAVIKNINFLINSTTDIESIEILVAEREATVKLYTNHTKKYLEAMSDHLTK
jgi:hypothetical protein